MIQKILEGTKSMISTVLDEMTPLKWVIVVTVGWLLTIMTLDIIGVINIETDCSFCAKVIEWSLVGDANAATQPMPVVDPALLNIRITFLPD